MTENNLRVKEYCKGAAEKTHSQLGMMKNPIIISQEHEDHIYILVTMGSQSRNQGQLTVKAARKEYTL